MSHRQSITIQASEIGEISNKWYNLPTVVNGRKVSPEKAIDWARKKPARLGKPFNNVRIAEETEGLRSEASMSPRFHLGDRRNNASSAIAELEKMQRHEHGVNRECPVCQKNYKRLISNE